MEAITVMQKSMGIVIEDLGLVFVIQDIKE
jgi:hypothetical protein